MKKETKKSRKLKTSGGRNMRKKDIKNNEKEDLIKKVEILKINLINALEELYSMVEKTKIAFEENKIPDYEIESFNILQSQIENLMTDIEKIEIKDKKLKFYGIENFEGLEIKIKFIDKSIDSLDDTAHTNILVKTISKVFGIKIDEKKVEELLKKRNKILYKKGYFKKLVDALNQVITQLYALQKLALNERLFSDITQKERKEMIQALDEWEKEEYK